MITSNVIQRTLHIKRDNSEGTAFTLDHGGKQYLVTARHVVEGIASGERIFVVHEGQRKPVKIRVVGVGEGDVDVAVLACQQQLTPMPPVGAIGAKGLLLWAASLLSWVPVRMELWWRGHQPRLACAVREGWHHQRDVLQYSSR